jgi:hypothetical protein
MTIEHQPDFEKVLPDDLLLQCYRRRNIRIFLGTSGHTQLSVSNAMGYSNSSFLGQMVGAYPTRPITEKTARRLENAFDLERLSLDKPTHITIDDLAQPDREKLNLSVTSQDEVLLMNKRKHARTDYRRFAEQAGSGIDCPTPGISGEKGKVQTELPTKQQSAAPTISECTMLELIDLIDSSELSSDKAMKVLKMSVKGAFKTDTLDKEFVQNLIALTK